jgi:hypothetical protein
MGVSLNDPVVCLILTFRPDKWLQIYNLEKHQEHEKLENDFHRLETRQDIRQILNKNHRTNASVTLQTPDWQIFGEKAAVLSPKQAEGPYCTTLHRKTASLLANAA